jgi:hypothetical protein
MQGIFRPVVFEGHKKVMSEPFSWGKFFGGLVDPTAYFKTLAIIVRVGLMIIICVLLALAVLKVKDVFFPKSKQQETVVITGQTGGVVANSKDQRLQKFGLLNLW